MTRLFPNIWEWSWFSAEKQLNFNGHFLQVGDHRILVDPPPLTSEDQTHIIQNGPLDYIIVTNRDHEREAASYKQVFHCQLFVPELDAPAMALPVDKTYRDGELLPGGIWVIQLEDQKSPGESALFLQQGNGILIVGDALIGNPPGTLSLLPPEKYADVTKARTGLRRLLRYAFDTVLVGDGTSVLSGAKPLVEKILH
ncbi:MAG: hypothetical protein D6704_04115 [Nitrospirae bacterium]|nr:MAG: hypothetical protein D6704_04115 [Nitrospirota bacterium]